MILGIDEVGRGPWAGPLVVGAVVLGGVTIDGLTDSKKLTKKRREELDVIIREDASGFGLGWVDASEIDKIGLSDALILATKRAVEQVKAPYHEIIIDGTINFLAGTSKGQYVKTLKKADLLIPSVSAASIIAKVARDNYMAEQDSVFPGYGFKSHVGYGTAAHRLAIESLGVTPLHRLSFAPLQKYKSLSSSAASISAIRQSSVRRTFSRFTPLSSAKLVGTQTFSTSKGVNRENVGDTTNVFPADIEAASIAKSTKQIGDDAETEVGNYLMRRGHKVLDRNWKTKYCEIDIVSQEGDVIYFTEVKYRKKPDQGGGLAAITPKKLRQMKFAAEYYALANKVKDTNLRLAVASLTGSPPTVEAFLDIK